MLETVTNFQHTKFSCQDQQLYETQKINYSSILSAKRQEKRRKLESFLEESKPKRFIRGQRNTCENRSKSNQWELCEQFNCNKCEKCNCVDSNQWKNSPFWEDIYNDKDTYIAKKDTYIAKKDTYIAKKDTYKGKKDTYKEKKDSNKCKKCEHLDDNNKCESSDRIKSNVGSRTLKLEYWTRTEECLQRKWDHIDKIDANYPSREEYILGTTLKNKDIVLEPNMFPYLTPANIEHWTLWSRFDLSFLEVEDYVTDWLNVKKFPVVRWNYEDNLERSINLFHVHVFLETSTTK